ncbi:MAG: hypothetical protein ACI32N_09890 [Bulleidia sp.]
MKRMIPVLMTLCILAGCAQPSVSMQDALNDAVAQVQTQQVQDTTHSKKYYSYYLPRDMGRYESTQFGNVLGYQGYRVLMSLNTPAILNARLYPDLKDSPITLARQEMSVSAQGMYTDLNDVEHLFEIGVYPTGYDYTVCMVSDVILFEAACPAVLVDDIAAKMIEIARSVQINENVIVETLSNQVTEIKSRQKVELFESLAPENGRIEELFEDHTLTDPGDVTNIPSQSPQNGGETKGE